jgi:hypothetical protein
VQPNPLTGQHVLVDGVPGQRVAEGIALPVGSDHEQVVLHGLAQRGEQLVLAQPRDLGEQPVRHGPARHRGGAQQLLRVEGERVHPAEQHVRQ